MSPSGPSENTDLSPNSKRTVPVSTCKGYLGVQPAVWLMPNLSVTVWPSSLDKDLASCGFSDASAILASCGFETCLASCGFVDATVVMILLLRYWDWVVCSAGVFQPAAPVPLPLPYQT